MSEIKPILSALRRAKVGAILLMIQITITTAIISNAAFIIYDRATYLNQETGYAEEEVFSFAITTFGKDIDLSTLFEETEDMIRAIPGVVDAAIMAAVPLSGSGSAGGFNTLPQEAQQDSTENRNVRAAYTTGDEHVFNTLGIDVSEGRVFRPEDVIVTNDPQNLASVAVVSRTFAEELFPDESAIGKVFYSGNTGVEIIGIVDKMKGPWLRDTRPDNLVIFPRVEARAYQKVAVRTAVGDRAAVMKSIEDAILAQYDKRVVINMLGMDESKAQYNASDLLMLRMLLVLIVVLVLITALGIFGMTVFNINKRTRQIGTRRALGARKSAIVKYFLVENGIICSLGLVFGATGAYYLGWVLFSEYSLPELNNLYILVTAVAVLLVSLLSVVLPAKRAANLSPSIATRSI
ncbi:FtsX-like permease family protein [Agaribacter flavus]|uniref:FtsX-like permease family protein n=1 Tax=Agaribacter flavus TaxID=1902781 RepID=A0ABV7FRX5_9ALTE